MGAQDGDLLLDPAIRNWVLVPITAVMLLTGILKHYITLLLTDPPKVDKKKTRETQALMRSRRLRMNGRVIPEGSAASRREYLTEKFTANAYIKDPPPADGAPAPMPAATMEASMEQMKKSLPAMIPHTLTMVWVQTLFKGFVMSA